PLEDWAARVLSGHIAKIEEFLKQSNLVSEQRLSWIKQAKISPGDKARLLAMELTDEDPVIRHGTVIALGHLDDPTTLPALQVALKDPLPQIRSNAAGFLVRLGDPTVCPSLKQLLDDQDSLVRFYVAKALTELGDSEGLPKLKEALMDKDSGIRSGAAR